MADIASSFQICLKLFNYLSNLVQKVSKKCSNLVRFDQSANCRKQFSLVFAFLCNAQMTISNGIFLVMLQWTTILKYGFCKKSFLSECTPDQLNTFSSLFGTSSTTGTPKWWKSVQLVHSERSNFLQNPYFSFYLVFDL